MYTQDQKKGERLVEISKDIHRQEEAIYASMKI